MAKGVNKVILVGAMSDAQIAAFWSKIEIKKSAKECWEWNGARKPMGYGNVRINKKYHLAHRVAFELSTTKIPDGLIVCHTCDNPSCCNPSHLMLGTTKSNSADMHIKGRQKRIDQAARGAGNGMAKLTDCKIKAIRYAYAQKQLNQYELAEIYGVSQPAIGCIVRNETWRHV